MNIRHRLGFSALILLLGLITVGCSARSTAAPSAAGAADATTVSVEQMAFAPAHVTIPKGSTLTWTWNSGAIAHDVVGDGFASEVQSRGSFTHRFDQTGNYAYHCSLHPNMTGTIEVTA